MLNFAQARTHMVDCQIHTSGVADPLILKAFGSVPRELFVPEKLQGIAYHDDALEIGQGRFLLEPAVHAKLIQTAKPVAADVVLDIGCGTGYSSAILSSIVTTVIAVENNKRQLDKAIKLWDKLGACNIVSLEGELDLGAQAYAPYSLIVLNGSVAQIPQNLCAQLAPKGRLICVVKPQGRSIGRAVLVYKDDSGAISEQELFDASAPYLNGFEPKPSFRF
jgi:protein-L-isoaspartate(D-aspartate) O-methyltransferase